MMTIKDIITNGGSVTIPYKEKEKDWVGSAKIHGFAGGYGCTPKIIVEAPTIDAGIGGRSEFAWDQIDAAVELYATLVTSKKNLCHKQAQAMLILHKDDKQLD